MSRRVRFSLCCLVLGALLALAACEFPSRTALVPTAVSPATLPANSVAARPTNEPAATVPPLPTFTPTPVPLPTPTYDPGLPQWTVLVYLDADNSLELPGLEDVNEMEAAGRAAGVNVLVQIDRAAGGAVTGDDWTEARRYLIQNDDDVSQIGSQPLMQLGEVNMGDPKTLADFLVWGISNYPANRYALILWDHGAGWNGLAFDDDVGFPDQSDHISMGDLDGALARALAQTGLDKLDVIGFDACLMAQLDVLQTVQPYADYAVASEELTPGRGWDYQVVLSHLYAQPQKDGSALAQQLVDDFAAYYRQTEPDDFVTMSAVDLARLSTLTTAVTDLAQAITADPTFVASAVGDARSGAEAFARVYADDFDRYAAVDLHHFAAILAQRSPDQRVALAAQQVMAAVDEAVVANERGAGFKNSQGVAIYWPRNDAFYAVGYGGVTTVPAWNDFLNSYHTAGMAQLPPPQINLNNVLSQTAGVQSPAYLDFEIVGRDIANVALIGGRYQEDGRRRLLEYDNLIPEPAILPDGSQLKAWRDGVHEDFFVWYTEVTYLYDAAGNGDYVVMWPTEPGSTLFTVQGRYRSAAAETYIDANLVFDQSTGQLMRVWGQQPGGGRSLAEILPQANDEFQLNTLYLDEEGQVMGEPGPQLFFDEAAQLYFDWRPLPAGDYFLGLSAENVAGETAEAFTDLLVDNSDLAPGYEAYFDPYLGFQFLYPESWHRPVYSDTLLYTTNLSATTQMQVTLYPNLEAGVDAATLKMQTLNLFGPVDVLFEDEVTVGDRLGLRTAYGYNGDGGQARTGLFFTFVKDGVGFVVDVDGPQAAEAATIDAVATMAQSWQFARAGFGLQPGEWATVDLEAFSVAQPADFAYQPYNEWQRFVADRHTFVALRSQPVTRPVTDVLAALVRDAGAGVTDFNAGQPYRLPLGGAVWQRADFSYAAADGTEIWGFIMVKTERDQEVVAWAEAPATVYNGLERDVFLVMIADLALAE